jgi:hypothetical protein
VGRPVASPVLDVLSRLQADVIMERRSLAREERQPFPRDGVVARINERIEAFRSSIEDILTALAWHREEWAHMPVGCLICEGTVRQ